MRARESRRESFAHSLIQEWRWKSSSERLTIQRARGAHAPDRISKTCTTWACTLDLSWWRRRRRTSRSRSVTAGIFLPACGGDRAAALTTNAGILPGIYCAPTKLFRNRETSWLGICRSLPCATLSSLFRTSALRYRQKCTSPPSMRYRDNRDRKTNRSSKIRSK